MPCILNAANERGVASFLNGKIKFTDMPRLVEYTMSHTPLIASPSLEDLVATNSEALAVADQWLSNIF